MCSYAYFCVFRDTWHIQWMWKQGSATGQPKSVHDSIGLSGHSPFYCSSVGALQGQESLLRSRSVVCLKARTSCCGRTSCKHHANPFLAGHELQACFCCSLRKVFFFLSKESFRLLHTKAKPNSLLIPFNLFENSFGEWGTHHWWKRNEDGRH